MNKGNVPKVLCCLHFYVAYGTIFDIIRDKIGVF